MATKVKAAKQGGGSVGSTGDVGLTATKISAMQKSLDQYIAEVTKKIKVGANTKNIEAAIKGSNAEAEVRKYIQEIDKACEDFLNNLRKYSDKLTEMANVYKANDKFSR